MSIDPTTILTYEEKDVIQDICTSLPSYFWVKSNTRNCYIYNDVQFYDITDQQINNDFNLSVGLISAETMATGNAEEAVEKTSEGLTEAYITTSTFLNKTFELHIWSVKKSNVETMNVAEIVRLAVRSFDNMLDTDSKINMYYRQLDNTNKPMNDCVFSVKLLTKDTIKRKVEIFDSAKILDSVIVKEKTITNAKKR